MRQFLFMLALLFCSNAAFSEPDDKVLSTRSLSAQATVQEASEQVSRRFEERFPGIQVIAVRLTPMPGIFEVQVGMDLLYTDLDVDYVLQGSLIDARARRDLSAERIQSLQKAVFESLPLDRAIRVVKGDGSRKVAVFEDPNCGYCKQLHQTIADIDDVTVYTFLFPILGPDSLTKARDIWCAADRSQVWLDWMLRGSKPGTAECETPIQANLELGRKLNVQGTPALFFPDGGRVNGALPLDELQKRLAAGGVAAEESAQPQDTP